MFSMTSCTTLPSRPEMMVSCFWEEITVFSALYTMALMRLSAVATLPERDSMKSRGSLMRHRAKESSTMECLSAVITSLMGRS